MPGPKLFLEEAGLLRDALAGLLRENPPDTLEKFEDLEYALEAATDLLDNLNRNGSAESLVLAGSTERVLSGLRSLRVSALQGEGLRSAATRSVFRRFRSPDPDVTETLIAVKSPFALQTDLRVLVEAHVRGVAGLGLLSLLPLWVCEVLCLGPHGMAGTAIVADRSILDEKEVLDTALSLWEPADPLSAFGEFDEALSAARGLLSC
jgi:hypothetical protein